MDRRQVHHDLLTIMLDDEVSRKTVSKLPSELAMNSYLYNRAFYHRRLKYGNEQERRHDDHS